MKILEHFLVIHAHDSVALFHFLTPSMSYDSFLEWPQGHCRHCYSKL